MPYYSHCYSKVKSITRMTTSISSEARRNQTSNLIIGLNLTDKQTDIRTDIRTDGRTLVLASLLKTGETKVKSVPLISFWLY